MKITNQDATPEQLAQLAKLVGVFPGVGAGIQVARTNKRVSRKSPSPPRKKITLDIEAAVDFLIEYQETVKNNFSIRAQRQAEIERLKRGDFSSGYWVECTLDETEMLECVPTYSDFVGPRNYAYPDPDFQPTIEAYPDGDIATGSITTAGETIAQVFRDTIYRWARYIFLLPYTVDKNDGNPIFLQITGTISGIASMQAARYLLSAVYTAWLVPVQSAHYGSISPPVDKPLSLWYPYKTPRGVAPFWSASIPLSILRSLRSNKFEEAAADNTSAVITLGVAPSWGRRSNNNASVSSTIAATMKLWMIRKSEPTFRCSNEGMDMRGHVSSSYAALPDRVVFLENKFGFAMVSVSGFSHTCPAMIDSAGNQRLIHGSWEERADWQTTCATSFPFADASAFYFLIQNQAGTELVMYEIDTAGDESGPVVKNAATYLQAFFMDDFVTTPWIPELSGWAFNAWTWFMERIVLVVDINGAMIRSISYPNEKQNYHYPIWSAENTILGFRSQSLNYVYWLDIFNLGTTGQPKILTCYLREYDNFSLMVGGNSFYIVDRVTPAILYIYSGSGELIETITTGVGAMTQRWPNKYVLINI